MKFRLSAEQRAFAEALDALLGSAGVPGVNRSWAAGRSEPGLLLWKQLAELGVTALGVPEEHGGVGGSPVDLIVAFERLGYHGVPGPVIESIAAAPALVSDPALLASLASGDAVVTFAAAPAAPYALDADVATDVFVVGDSLSRAEIGRKLTSVDPSRHLFEVTAGPAGQPLSPAARDRALDLASLACAAVLLGCGERMLADTVAYLGQRKQFGRVIGEYQALKHAAADVRVALDFARPLLLGAAREPSPRAVSAAKVSASDAAQLAARTGLQLHGAIGYTLECDLSQWLLRVRALVGCWGTPAVHRARVLESLMRDR
ncbi:acyl-CoA dehydrogenase family protein [Amycolatopsis benzoatilytica]|uniref:acyl-CoA dehydrogenase family protein n=1 Tax=Amycolatopsis benzoatilytica TaxID=346045 RepID=UPI000365ED49|nr:acyl-CoA dehydrogenase family protein [Amycolatopsis benzoatilytica]